VDRAAPNTLTPNPSPTREQHAPGEGNHIEAHGRGGKLALTPKEC
jgi:hypothetical protein